MCLALASISTRFAGAAWAWFLLAGLASLWITRASAHGTPPNPQAHELARTWLIFTAVALALKTVPMLYWHDPWAERHAELRLFLGAVGLYGVTRLQGLSQKAQQYLTLAGSIYCTAGLGIILHYGQFGTPTNSIPWAAGMAMVSCWLLGIFYTRAACWTRWLALAGSIAGLLAVLASEKRGAYALLIVLPCMTWFLWRQQANNPAKPMKTGKSLAIYVACIVVGAASLWSLRSTPLIQRPTNAITIAIQELKQSHESLSANYHSSVGARLYLWKQSTQAATKSLWIGYGHDQRKALLQKWAHDTHLADPLIFGHVHNDYLHALLDHGLWGLASFLSYAAGLIVLIVKLARQQSWPSAATLGGILIMHLTTAISNVNFAHNYYPTLLSLMIGITLWSCIDPVKNCSGVIFEGNTNEHTDGRRHQTLDGQAQSSLGHGNHSRQNDSGTGQPIV